MKAVLIFLRHLADYIVGLTYIIITLTAWLVIVWEHFPDAEPEIKFFVWVVTAGIIAWIYAIIADSVDHTKNDLDPNRKMKYNIQVLSKNVDKSFECKTYSIDHVWERIELTMDWSINSLPTWTTILVTDL